ncbi:hypothetical protein EVAR_11836_1 [Eumeta japonica]|uniref:Uncharacterized protein n=1 Tax=Eumeta variegata TaxID=151549 RepID=A0A4C1YQ37_EUMVA|nr:hypothetical protein EVAR_11836_1 [Eumeta japonica]
MLKARPQADRGGVHKHTPPAGTTVMRQGELRLTRTDGMRRAMCTNTEHKLTHDYELTLWSLNFSKKVA